MRIERVKLVCSFCGNTFERLPCEYRKSKARAVGEYKPTCSNRCRVEHLNKIRRRDDFTPFRKMFYKTKFTSRKHKQGNLTLEDVYNQWVKQDGVCPYTGVKMILPATSHDSKGYSPKWASIDRVDSSKPYDKENIQIVCLSINFAKSSFSDSEFKAFIQEIIPNKLFR